MFRQSNIQLLITYTIAILVFAGCASTSMEYRSATTAARTEKNLKKAEVWALKALDVPGDENNALVPYFLAIEIYLPQKNWKIFAEMLIEAENRNSDQKLERPFMIDNKPVVTIGEGVNVYRDQEWNNIYNQAIDQLQNKEIEKAKESLIISISINPNRGESYGTLSTIYMMNKELENARKIAKKGILAASEYHISYQRLGEIEMSEGNLEKAETLFGQAIEKTEDPGPIMRQLLFVYIDGGKTQQAIEYSEELLNQFPDDPDLYYNVGVLYQKLALNIFDPTREKYLSLSDESTSEILNNVYQSFQLCRKYANNAKDNFMQSSDLEIESDGSSNKAVSEMRKLMKQIDELFVPSVIEIARTAKVSLD